MKTARELVGSLNLGVRMTRLLVGWIVVWKPLGRIRTLFEKGDGSQIPPRTRNPHSQLSKIFLLDVEDFHLGRLQLAAGCHVFLTRGFGYWRIQEKSDPQITLNRKILTSLRVVRGSLFVFVGPISWRLGELRVSAPSAFILQAWIFK